MPVWKCPACATALILQEKTWSCLNGHSYDVAKEGYVNLLLVQQKNSKQPGDNKEMVNGRRAFLEQGYYQPLADAIANLFIQHLTSLKGQKDVSFFDAGCGEGYYMGQVGESCHQTDSQIEYSGLDISKFAVQKAAKKYPKNHFAVASSFQLPLLNNSQDTVLQIFAPSSEQEVHRVLKTGGIWITVNPASQHLQQIKQALYDNPTEHKSRKFMPEGFALSHQSHLSFTFELTDASQRENLLMMTPYYWTATEQKKQDLINNLSEVTTDFDIRVFVKV
jgi:23S rRNA (guanine745-N1)-methyltransferase